MANTVDQGNITTAHAKDLNTAARKYCASQGWALSDGSYPIRPADNHGRADLADAIMAVGRGNTSTATIRQHIVTRAKAINATDLLPGSYAASTKPN